MAKKSFYGYLPEIKTRVFVPSEFFGKKNILKKFRGGVKYPKKFFLDILPPPKYGVFWHNKLINLKHF